MSNVLQLALENIGSVNYVYSLPNVVTRDSILYEVKLVKIISKRNETLKNYKKKK